MSPRETPRKRLHHISIRIYSDTVSASWRQLPSFVLLWFVEFRVDQHRFALLLPIGVSRLQGHIAVVPPGCGVLLVGRRIRGRLLLLNGIRDGHIVGEVTLAVLHGRRITRGCAIENRTQRQKFMNPQR